MKEVCKDVKIKPGFIPIDNSNMINGNTADQSRLDAKIFSVTSITDP